MLSETIEGVTLWDLLSTDELSEQAEREAGAAIISGAMCWRTKVLYAKLDRRHYLYVVLSTNPEASSCCRQQVIMAALAGQADGKPDNFVIECVDPPGVQSFTRVD